MELYIDKGSDLTFATLKAFGIAQLVERIPPPNSKVVCTIHDNGSAYCIECNVTEEQLIGWVSERGLPSMLPSIVKALTDTEEKEFKKGIPKEEILRRYVPQGFTGTTVDYEAQKEMLDPAESDKKSQVQEGAPAVRHRDYPVWAHLCSYFGKGSAMRKGYPLLIHVWHAHQERGTVELAQLIFASYKVFPNDVEGIRQQWGKTVKPSLHYEDFALFGWGKKETDVSALSIVSPSTAQGADTAAGWENIKITTPDVFWLELYLAFVGYMMVGMPYRASGGDVVLYYPLPRSLELRQARNLVAKYRQDKLVQQLYRLSGLYPRNKLDSLSALMFYINQINQWIGVFEDEEDHEVNHSSTNGLVGYYYKEISTQVPFDETTFNLPIMLDSEKLNLESLHQLKTILESHRQIIQSIPGEYAEELEILSYYRRYLSFGHPDDWLEFVIHYGHYRFLQAVDKSWLPFLEFSLLEHTLDMSKTHKDYRPILDNHGFKNIAKAINDATVYARWKKDVKKDSTYPFKVRHGLGTDLRRNSHDADQFIQDLSDFIHDYTQESSSVQANTTQSRQWITPEDIHDVIGLVNQYGSRVVASLLVATGYAHHVFSQTKSNEQE